MSKGQGNVFAEARRLHRSWPPERIQEGRPGTGSASAKALRLESTQRGDLCSWSTVRGRQYQKMRPERLARRAA